MRRLNCAFVVRIWHKQFFSWHGSVNVYSYPDIWVIGDTVFIIGMHILQNTVLQHWRNIWAASSEFGTYRLCEQRRFRRACASAQSRLNVRCWLMQAVRQEEPSDRKPDPWLLWMSGHAQLWWNARRHKFAWRGSFMTLTFVIHVAGVTMSSPELYFKTVTG